MINSKKRAMLRGMANSLPVMIQIGKSGITDEVKSQVSETIYARELVKIRVLETANLSAKDAAKALQKALHVEIVQVIGTCIVLYQPNPEQKVIELP